jgi:hypothetical protein
MRRTSLRLAAALLLVPVVHMSAQPVGSEFRVNTYTTSAQVHPAVAAAPDGSFVVVWSSDGEGSPLKEYDVFGQRFSAAGAPLGTEFPVNSITTGGQTQPAVAVDSQGNFVVVWAGDDGGYGYHVRGRRFSSAGALLGAEFRVNSATTGQRNPAVASDAAGNLVIVWQELVSGLSLLFGQRYTASGTALGERFQVNSNTGYDTFTPRVSMSAGGFVVVWNKHYTSPTREAVFGRRFGAGGAPAAPEFRLSTYTGDTSSPAVAADAAGGFVAVWRSLGQDVFCGTGIHGQRFSAGGAPLGTEIAVTGVCFGLDISQPSVGSDPFGNFAVAWRVASGGNAGIIARRFTNVGDAPSEFVASTTTGTPKLPAVAAGYDGFTIVWQSPLQDGSVDGVYGQLFSPGLQGDVDGNGQVNVADVFYLINFLFAGGPRPIGASDASGDGQVNVADVFYLINFLFAGGPPPF